MKYLIAGLGNIGFQYDNTRHNIGFSILDALAGASNVVFETMRYGDLAQLKYKGRTLILLKPNTFMNLSGKSVNYWLNEEKIALDKLLVVTDDLNLPFGKQRLRLKGSDGGHNGLKNITYLLNTNQYARLRFGVGNDFSPGKQIDFVLSKWDKTEEVFLEERVKVAMETILSFAFAGGLRTMTEFNNK